MDKNWYTNESVWSLNFFYPNLQEDLKKKKKKSKWPRSTRIPSARWGPKHEKQEKKKQKQSHQPPSNGNFVAQDSSTTTLRSINRLHTPVTCGTQKQTPTVSTRLKHVSRQNSGTSCSSTLSVASKSMFPDSPTPSYILYDVKISVARAIDPHTTRVT